MSVDHENVEVLVVRDRLLEILRRKTLRCHLQIYHFTF